jgi:hypothetical protein
MIVVILVHAARAFHIGVNGIFFFKMAAVWDIVNRSTGHRICRRCCKYVYRFACSLCIVLVSVECLTICTFLVIVDKLTGQEFNVTEYGLCFIEDLLGEVTGSVIQVCNPFS